MGKGRGLQTEKRKICQLVQYIGRYGGVGVLF